MGAITPGTKQKTYYVREDLARILAMVSSREDRFESDVVNEAFEHYVTTKLTAEELRVFGYKKEKKNDNDSRASSVDSGPIQRPGDGTTGSGPHSPPGTKKRAGKASGSHRRTTKPDRDTRER